MAEPISLRVYPLVLDVRNGRQKPPCTCEENERRWFRGRGVTLGWEELNGFSGQTWLRRRPGATDRHRIRKAMALAASVGRL